MELYYQFIICTKCMGKAVLYFLLMLELYNNDDVLQTLSLFTILNTITVVCTVSGNIIFLHWI